MDIKKMRAIHKKATFLPWKYRGDNADYITTVISSLPKALDEIERLKMALQQIADYTLLTGEDAREMKCISESALGEGN